MADPQPLVSIIAVNSRRAANRGALASRGQFLCFLNSGTQVPQGWLERMVEAARRPGVGAVRPLSRPSCLLIPKPVMARVGLFEEGVDYCRRLQMHGYRVLRRWPRKKPPTFPPGEIPRTAPAGNRGFLLRGGFLFRYGARKGLARFSDLETYAPTPSILRTWRRLEGLASPGRRPSGIPTLLREKLVLRVRPAAARRPLVTVMMAAHNSERWISQAIESVLAQRFRSFELIIADDGSGDGTPAAVRGYVKHPQVRFLRNPWQMGIAATRNRVLGEARGRYIAVCDSDDILLATHLERFVPLLEKNPRAAWVYSDRLMISGNGTFLQVDPAVRPDGRKELQKNIISHAGALIRLDAILQAGGYDPSYSATEDYDLALKISERARILCLPGEVHYLWRQHPQKTSRTNPWKILDTRRLLEEARARRARAGRRPLRQDRHLQAGQPAQELSGV